MAEKFKEYGKLDLTEVNRDVLDNWHNKEEKEGHPSFIFYEGPPSANGMPGIHHVLARTIKDIICRYKTMKGFQINRQAG